MPKSSEDKIKGLIASCFDLFEDYGNNLLEALKELKPPKRPRMYFSLGAPSNKKSKEELEKEQRLELKKQEEKKKKAKKYRKNKIRSEYRQRKSLLYRFKDP